MSDRSSDRRALGAAGERMAARHLEQRGYRILDRNVRAGGVEIDLVAARGALVVFAEVKTRRSSHQGAPEHAVDAAKQRRLVRGARAWLQSHPGRVRRVRFDVVACRLEVARGEERWSVDHLPGAFGDEC